MRPLTHDGMETAWWQGCSEGCFAPTADHGAHARPCPCPRPCVHGASVTQRPCTGTHGASTTAHWLSLYTWASGLPASTSSDGRASVGVNRHPRLKLIFSRGSGGAVDATCAPAPAPAASTSAAMVPAARRCACACAGAGSRQEPRIIMQLFFFWRVGSRIGPGAGLRGCHFFDLG